MTASVSNLKANALAFASAEQKRLEQLGLAIGFRPVALTRGGAGLTLTAQDGRTAEGAVLASGAWEIRGIDGVAVDPREPEMARIAADAQRITDKAPLLYWRPLPEVPLTAAKVRKRPAAAKAKTATPKKKRKA